MIRTSTGAVALLTELLAVIAMSVAVGAALVRGARQRRRTQQSVALAVARPLLLATIAAGSATDLAGPGLPRRVSRCLDSLAIDLATKLRGSDRGVLTEFLRYRGTLQRAGDRTRSTLAVRRLRAVELLGALGVTECRSDLERCLQDRNADVRRAAVRALGRSGAPEAVPALLALLDAAERRVPEHCVTLALTRCGPAAAPALTAALRGTGPHARRAAAQVLGWLGATAAVDALCGLLDDGSVPLRLEAIVALGRIGAPGTATRLRGQLAAGRPIELRAAAAVALGRLDDTASIPALAGCLGERHDLARAAATALAQLGTGGQDALALAAPEVAEAREALGVPVGARARGAEG